MRRIALTTSPVMRVNASSSGIAMRVSGSMISCTSPPEQKLPPAPVSTIARTSLAVGEVAEQVAQLGVALEGQRVLLRSGRLSVIVATRPSSLASSGNAALVAAQGAQRVLHRLVMVCSSGHHLSAGDRDGLSVDRRRAGRRTATARRRPLPAGVTRRPCGLDFGQRRARLVGAPAGLGDDVLDRADQQRRVGEAGADRVRP